MANSAATIVTCRPEIEIKYLSKHDFQSNHLTSCMHAGHPDDYIFPASATIKHVFYGE
jgi:hypothetical protein